MNNEVVALHNLPPVTSDTDITHTTKPYHHEEDEENRLLSDEDTYDDDDYDNDDQQNYIPTNYTCPSMLWRNRTIRYIMIGVFIAFSFLLFRITLALVAHKYGHEHYSRPVERLYHNGSEYYASTVILISLDGFKPAYLDLGITPNLIQLANEGIQANYMYPSFPTLTFPNHWTLVTGMYPESHGIVANDFYDPTMEQTFQHYNKSSNTDPHWWQAAEPIWVTANNFNRISASIMWPGSGAIPPTYLYPFNATTSPSEVADLTLELLDMPYNKRPQFISAYIHQVDSAGHAFGPNDDAIKTSIRQADHAIGKLLEGLKQRHIDEHAHIVVVSDHGMAKTDNYIYYDDILSTTSLSYLRHREAWPLLDLRPLDDTPPNATHQIYGELASYAKQYPDDAHYQVYLKEDVPTQYHYNNNERISPIVTIPDPGYAFVNHDDTDPSSGVSHQPIGMHGYDLFHSDMLAIFMAKGPKINRWFPVQKTPTIATSVTSFKKRILAPFHNVEVYEFLTELLNINGNPNNGTLHGKLVLASSISS
ncbi:alkaline-phosphatase-like protein [Halteromyces radiatus]|uniref:alkaline-phosphatase-like protein n=1 Tax=Halteromyces radiatus TaxID=101107 RepID=UPI002220A9A1|nr:alkaline-phosphatase-like protein [Halteromyces radiatus]KAI8084628.1 alkaline-phosphatase-like protein [Halteromyces radiatus]